MSCGNPALILGNNPATAAHLSVYSLPGRPTQFRAGHMRNDPTLVGDAAKQPVTVAANCLLVKNAGPNQNLTILCDAGSGLHLPAATRSKLGIPDRDLLVENLAMLGVSLADIDIFISSHPHWDHIGGILDETGNLRLPKAHILLSRGAYQQNMENPAIEGQPSSFIPGMPEKLQALKQAGRLTLLSGDPSGLGGEGITCNLLGDAVRFYFSGGHSECQMHAVFLTDAGGVVFGGDFFPTAWHVAPERYMPQFDRDPKQLANEKELFLQRVRTGHWHISFYHDPQVAAARVLVGGPERYSSLIMGEEVRV